MTTKSRIPSELEILTTKFIADNETTSEEDSTIKNYCKAMWMTLDEILPPKNTWNMKELEIPDSRLM